MSDQQLEQPPNPPPRPAPTLAYSWQSYSPNPQCIYICTHEQANILLAKLGSSPQVFGFDMEWKPTFKKGQPENPVALVQLANKDTVYLLHISRMQEFPIELKTILLNPLIVKAGVAIYDDSLKLFHDYRVEMRNCVDLSRLARTVDNNRWKGKYSKALGLATLIETYEYRILLKGKLARSNWEASLSRAQQQYAGNDAHAGFILYDKLFNMTADLPYTTERTCYSYDLINGQLVTENGELWQGSDPNYDPGPPPTPKVPKPAIESLIGSIEAKSDESFLSPADSSRTELNHFQNSHAFSRKNPTEAKHQTWEASGSGSGSKPSYRANGSRSRPPQMNDSSRQFHTSVPVSKDTLVSSAQIHLEATQSGNCISNSQREENQLPLSPERNPSSPFPLSGKGPRRRRKHKNKQP